MKDERTLYMSKTITKNHNGYYLKQKSGFIARYIENAADFFIYCKDIDPENLKVIEELDIRLKPFDEVAESINEGGFAAYELIQKMKRVYYE